jgi:hypothetical protein
LSLHPLRKSMTRIPIVILAGLLLPSFLQADPDTPADSDPRIASVSEFPDPGHSTYFAGEIILVEHVNRRGILRLDRDGTINKYHWDLPHHFEMLPYGAIYLKGAPASMKDLPLGIHLHGEFHLGPEGEIQVKPPVSGYVAGKMARPDLRSVESKFSRVVRLEDDFSFHLRHGVGWKIKRINEAEGTLVAETVSLSDGSSMAEVESFPGMKEDQIFRIDPGCHVWVGDRIGSLMDLAEGQVVQMNLGRVTLLGNSAQDGLCREIWIDSKSQAIATERQRQVHIAYRKRRGAPALVLETEHMAGEGARGYLTVELFEGIDESLLVAFETENSFRMRVAEPSLRTYDINDIKPVGSPEVTRIESPAPGSSGVRVRFQCSEMVEGFRKGRTVLVFPSSWLPPQRPREERLFPNDTRIFKVGPKHVTDRDGPPVSVEASE